MCPELCQLRAVDDVAQAEIEMSVHALQVEIIMRSEVDGNPEQVLADGNNAGAPDEPGRHGELFSGLSQPSHVNLYGFRQAGNDEVPFVSQAIAQTAGRDFGFEAGRHERDDFAWIGIGVEVEVAAQIGPVIERLDHRDIVSLAFEREAYLVKKCESQSGCAYCSAASAASAHAMRFLIFLFREGPREEDSARERSRD